ncbi:UNKNOWN [Stylonychia lemnae]|uniref:Uncharacterized protein n=1 Tax=Stylonychia lemnae TaxID=5949 RepID=A0A078A5B3_STYLE|nr:UNKNOWN [Stylonychia lemnae]|eukprot:CDW75944.1 UNKNOWN [Stylonychia lemnae]
MGCTSSINTKIEALEYKSNKVQTFVEQQRQFMSIKVNELKRNTKRKQNQRHGQKPKQIVQINIKSQDNVDVELQTDRPQENLPQINIQPNSPSIKSAINSKSKARSTKSNKSVSFSPTITQSSFVYSVNTNITDSKMSTISQSDQNKNRDVQTRALRVIQRQGSREFEDMMDQVLEENESRASLQNYNTTTHLVSNDTKSKNRLKI